MSASSPADEPASGTTDDDEAARRAAFEELLELSNQYDWPDDRMVCVTHRRFVPCRTEKGCVLSTDPADVEMVERWQWIDES